MGKKKCGCTSGLLAHYLKMSKALAEGGPNPCPPAAPNETLLGSFFDEEGNCYCVYSTSGGGTTLKPCI